MTEPIVTADVCALILAAGTGDRMGTARPKQYLELGDQDDPHRTVIDLLLTSYESADEVGEVRLVCDRENLDLARSIAARYRKVRSVVIGGETRHDSVRLGLAAVATKITLIHDAARPLLHLPAVTACLEKFRQGAHAVVTTVHPYASMLISTDDGPITGVMERDEIVFAMCPVGYYTADLREGFARAAEEAVSYRDEPALMRALRPDIVAETVPGHRSGFKLTYPEDMEVLAAHRRLLDRL